MTTHNPQDRSLRQKTHGQFERDGRTSASRGFLLAKPALVALLWMTTALGAWAAGGGHPPTSNDGGIDWALVKDLLEAISFAVTIVALPFAVLVWARDQRKELENDEEEQYQHLSDAYNGFLRVVLEHADLQLRAAKPLNNPTPEQRERMLTIFDMLTSLFERAYLVAHKPAMTADEQRRWNSWDDYMREWIRRDDFHNALPQLLSGEDPEFQEYIRMLVKEERASAG